MPTSERDDSDTEAEGTIVLSSKMLKLLCTLFAFLQLHFLSASDQRCVHSNARASYRPHRARTRINPPAHPVSADVLFHGAFHAAALHDL